MIGITWVWFALCWMLTVKKPIYPILVRGFEWLDDYHETAGREMAEALAE